MSGHISIVQVVRVVPYDSCGQGVVVHLDGLDVPDVDVLFLVRRVRPGHEGLDGSVRVITDYLVTDGVDRWFLGLLRFVGGL